jgi:hypothetical protein
MYTLFDFFLIFNDPGKTPAGGMNGQKSLGFCDIMNQKQNKQTYE